MRSTRRLEGGWRIRRSRRTDLARVRALLPPRGEARAERFDRRTLADPKQDVYVAESASGTIVGVVAVGYVRSLHEGRHLAVLDAARIAPDAAPVLDALLDLAEARARQRGCRRVHAWPAADDGALRTALLSRGWSVAEDVRGRLEGRA